MVAYFTDIFCHGIASKKVSIQGTTNFMKGTAPQNPGEIFLLQTSFFVRRFMWSL